MKLSPPGPKGIELFKSLMNLSKDPLGVIERLNLKYGDFIGVNVFGRRIILVSHPKYIQHILKDNFKTYFKRGQDFEEVRPIIGNGLVLSDGDLWLQQRRTLSREFHKDSVERFIPDMMNVTKMALEKWDKKDLSDIDMYEEFMLLTLEIAALLFLGTPIQNAHVFHDAIEFNGRLAEARIRSGIRVPRGCPLPSHIKASKKVKAMDQIIFKIISDYKKNPTEHVNILSRLVKFNESNPTMSDQQLRDEVVTMLLAGHETTSSTLCWVFYNLAQHSEWQEQLAQEAQDVLSDDAINLESINRLVKTKAFIQESMRLFPTVANLDRQATDDDMLDGFEIKKKTTVNISIYMVHRHPEFWENPLVFDPNRFLGERLEKIHPYSYLPFGRGPRACIGELLATVETQLIVAFTLKKMKVSLVKPGPIKMLPRITMVPEGGLHMKLKQRASNV